ncbi:hypothetical protein [Thiomonas bhubaneswarensis]|uniref:Uncharacterized protein n=1 Tax=Thiomonas bhubaneswarensis TaxID=339866 RepID=A0A0K6I8X5_9BURK|nr:hypothetical protein [Thiomonas bhubaneswarensis]CUA99767.1 hypothetical protein Ga0061069_11091 [Thiomonas bhubaneswarensis]
MRPATGTAQTVFDRPIQRNRPVLAATLATGLVLVLYCGGAAVLAVSAFAIMAIASCVTGFLRLHWRGMLDWARANIDLMVVSLLAVPMFAISVSIPLLASRQRLLALTRKAISRRTARVGHRRIAHIALTARVVPAPIARA